MFKGINYKDLKPRQKENYNFQKVAAVLADYGYNCMRLSDDWEGADFIACHIDGNTFLKIQLKTRLHFAKKYEGKDIYIAFRENRKCYIYPHDELLEKFRGKLDGTKSWDDDEVFSWDHIPKKSEKLMARYAK